MDLSSKSETTRVRFAGLVAVSLIATLAVLAAAAGGGAATRRTATASAAAAVHIHPTYRSRLVSRKAPPTTDLCVAVLGVPCYGAAQMQTAYDVGPLLSHGITGAGQTIVIIDSFGSPTIQADLATFDSEMGLPDPPSFQIIQPVGAVPPYDPTDANGDVDWAGETTLDVEWAHAMAPGANILLVETPVAETEGINGFPQILQAVNYVVSHHLGSIISQSFGATEPTFPFENLTLLLLHFPYANAAKHGVTVLAGTGDEGSTDYSDTAATTLFTRPAVDWPASDPAVTAVGGTQLSLDDNGNRTAPDQVWNDTFNPLVNEGIFGDDGPNALATGGGLSEVFPRPSYQNGVANVVGYHRGVPDISMSGACSGLVLTYQSFGGEDPGWYVTCGTSEATPLFAGIVALADQMAGHSLGLINPTLYTLSAEKAPGLVDVTTGNNTVSFFQDGVLNNVPGYAAGPGYDLASGVGTVDAAQFVPELAAGH